MVEVKSTLYSVPILESSGKELIVHWKQGLIHTRARCTQHRNNFFCPLLENFCPLFNILSSWGPFCTDSSSFCPFSSPGQEKGYFGVWLGAFCVCAYPWKGFGVAGGVLGKWDPILANLKWYPSGQFVLKVGKNALELGNVNSIIKSTYPFWFR